MAIKKTELETQVSEAPILGVYKGECADASITNNNGLDITYEVWDNVFKSEEFKKAIELGHYIGFLGHPEDPGCQDFEHACIVMTAGSIEENGKVHGEFNLINTPVGRIVKAFQDGGVTFGISVRGAGDVINNSVDPDTFVFRGFDLVTFPAYPESIPEFTAIAASTDSKQQKKYQKICAAVQAELPNITSCDALDMIQSQFPEQSEVYQEVEDRKCELNQDNEECDLNPEDRIALLEKQVEGVMSLYLDTVKKMEELQSQLAFANTNYQAAMIQSSRKIHAMTRICANQNKLVEEAEEEYLAESEKLERECDKVIKANKQLKATLKRVKGDNLQYQQKIESSETEIQEKEKIICSLQDELDKTVVSSKSNANRLANLDKQNRELQQCIEASQKLVDEYQDAYASLYSKAVGANLNNLSVTASTDVNELQKIISSSVASSQSVDVFVEPQQIDLSDEFDEDTLITM